MLEDEISALENFYKEKGEQIKKRIERQIEIEFRKNHFLLKLLFNNKGIQEFIEENKLTPEQIDESLYHLTNNIGLPGLEKRDGQLISIAEANKTIYIKSGYYKINSSKELSPETLVERVGLIPTEEGNKIFKEYRELINL